MLTTATADWTTCVADTGPRYPVLYLNRSPHDSGLVPPGVAIRTLTVPAPECDGVAALISRADTTLKLRAGLGPKFTLRVPVKCSPLITTAVPGQQSRMRG